eukprot:TRINITY_DN1782_c0_g1_i1.p1 TRINITY_DN1782_c0_g1~~TRINITY_DN1782_c0_g1_i1.p1  ORF type:complete len:209 (-),score=70.81 TRINITY_DN1782_c0_g1_i1:221-847(-)
MNKLSFFLVLLLPTLLNCFEFHIQPQVDKCFVEELRSDALVVGDYSINPPVPGLKLTFQIHDPTGLRVWFKEGGTESTFAFTASKSGDYSFCFVDVIDHNVPQGHSDNRIVSFDLRTGVRAFDYSAVAKKENLKPIDLELRKMEDMVKDIIKELEYMRKREAEMRDTNESINSRVAWVSILSVVALVSLGLWQVWYLKRYFHQKKVLN